MKRIVTCGLVVVLMGAAGGVSAQSGGGCILLERAEYERIAVAPVPPRLRNPIPLRCILATPPVLHQGTQRSCTAWATAYAATGILAMRKYGREVQLSPSFVYNQIQKRENEGMCLGTYVRDALILLETQGVCQMSLMSYDEWSCGRQPSAEMHGAALSNRVRWGRLANEADVEEYKLRIASGQPVVISVYCTTEYTKHAGGDGYWCEYGVIPEKSKTHAMCVVGYDDRKVHGGRRGFLKVMNSIGESRGDGGFLWIAYDLVREKRIEESYAVYGISADVGIEGGETVCSGGTTYSLTNGAPEWGVRWEANGKAEVSSASGHTMVAKSVRNEMQDEDGWSLVKARILVPGDWPCEAVVSRGVWAGGPVVTLCQYVDDGNGGPGEERCGPSASVRIEVGGFSGLETTVWGEVKQGGPLYEVSNSNPKVAVVTISGPAIVPHAVSRGGTVVVVGSDNECGADFGHVSIWVDRRKNPPNPRPDVQLVGALR